MITVFELSPKIKARAARLRMEASCVRSRNPEDQVKYQRGEQSPRHKLTDNKIRWIRILANEGYSQRELAADYDVSQATICGIVFGSSWQHVTPIPFEQLVAKTPGLEDELENESWL